MKEENFRNIEDLMADGSFLNYYFNRAENDTLDWEDWQGEDQARIDLVKKAFQALDTLSLKFNESQITQKVKKLQDKLSTISNEDKKTGNIFPLSTMLKVASIFILFSIVAFFVESKFDGANPKLAQVEKKEPTLFTNNEIGHVKDFILSDGTKIKLNSGSTITISDQYNLNNRDIKLDGEAFFEVAKNKDMPFKVFAKNTITTAIGTSFSIRSYKGDNSVKVLLVEGKVEVKTNTINVAKVQLNEGQQVSVLEEKLSSIENITNVVEEIKWIEDLVFNFKENSFKEVMHTIAEYHQIPIVGYENSVLEKSFITAEIEKSTPLNSIMEALAFSNNFEYTIDNDVVKIIPKN